MQTSWLRVLYNRSYCQSKFYIAGIEIFDLFGSCDLDLDPMPFIYELDPYPWSYTACAKMNLLRQGFRNLSSDIHTYIQTYRQTRPKLYATPLRRWSIIICVGGEHNPRPLCHHFYLSRSKPHATMFNDTLQYTRVIRIVRHGAINSAAADNCTPLTPTYQHMT